MPVTLTPVSAGTVTLTVDTLGSLSLSPLLAGGNVLCSETLPCSDSLACSDHGITLTAE